MPGRKTLPKCKSNGIAQFRQLTGNDQPSCTRVQICQKDHCNTLSKDGPWAVELSASQRSDLTNNPNILAIQTLPYSLSLITNALITLKSCQSEAILITFPHLEGRRKAFPITLCSLKVDWTEEEKLQKCGSVILMDSITAT